MLELNKIYHMDCLEGMKLMSDDNVDLTVTSPPYDNLRNYNGYSFDFEGIAKELYRITKNGGVVVWIVGDSTVKGSESGTSFKQALYFKDIGFNLHDTMIYGKKSWVPLTHRRYEQQFEYMFVLSKGRPKTFNPIMIPCSYAGTKPSATFRQDASGTLARAHSDKEVKNEKIAGNIFMYDTGFMKTTKDKYAYKHPAMFPEQLAKDHILSWLNEGDIVFDPFMGSGTTAKIALMNNRKYIGFETSEEYIEIANERLKITSRNKSFVRKEVNYLNG